MNAIHVRMQRELSQPRTERASLASFILLEPRQAHKDVPEWVKNIPPYIIKDRLDKLKKERHPEQDAPQPELRLPIEEFPPRRGQREDEEPSSRVVIIDPENEDLGGSGVIIFQV